ncbi:MAG: hypothetical protein AAFV88_04095 [Planctomycetota bacterium]
MLRDTSRDNAPGPPPIHTDSIKDALAMLARASEYANDADCSAWDFAIEIHRLLAVGVNECDLRWLACKGYTEHACEVTNRNAKSREFTYEGDLTLCESSCFVLTDAGARMAVNYELVCANPALEETALEETALEETVLVEVTEPCTSKPIWNRDRRELMYRGKLVKRFRLPSPNQELVLLSFQEDGWPSRIDDPLPPVFEKDVKRRLRDTINSLNRYQKSTGLRFAGDGTGEGVIWEDANGEA